MIQRKGGADRLTHRQCKHTNPVPEVYQSKKTPWQVSRKNGNRESSPESVSQPLNPLSSFFFSARKCSGCERLTGELESGNLFSPLSFSLSFNNSSGSFI